jgi:hypothetical protein
MADGNGVCGNVHPEISGCIYLDWIARCICSVVWTCRSMEMDPSCGRSMLFMRYGDDFIDVR